MWHFVVFEALKGIELAGSSSHKLFSCFLGLIHSEFIFVLAVNQIKSGWLRALVVRGCVEVVSRGWDYSKFVPYDCVEFA